jgi:GT2 family glycosyltransferase
VRRPALANLGSANAPGYVTPAESVRLTAVIPTYERREVVLDSVRALYEQDVTSPFEVIVVVDGSRNGSAAALSALDPPIFIASARADE